MVLEDLFRRPSTLARFRMPPLGPMMDGFCGWLHSRGCSEHGVRLRLRQVSQFNRYLRRRSVKDSKEVTTRNAERFIHEHLRRYRCGRCYRRRGTPQSVRYLMDYLSERGLLGSPSPPCSQNQKLLKEYLDHLKYERHLAADTIKAHQRYLTPLLKELGAAPAKRLHRLSPKQVLAFLRKYANERGPSSRRNMQGALRSFLRFCLQQGYLERGFGRGCSTNAPLQAGRCPSWHLGRGCTQDPSGNRPHDTHGPA